MKFWLGVAAAMGIALLLGGCDTVSKEQCQAGDWRALGRADAASGHAANRISKVAEDCGQYGISPDPAAYQSGWQEGVQIYCTPLNGFNIGRQGDSKSDICPPALAGQFEYAYQLGNRIYSARREVENVESRLRYLESSTDSARFDLSRLDCGSGSPDERNACRQKADRLRDRISDGRFEIQDLRFRLMQRQGEYAATEAAVNAEARRLISGYGG
ncbi:DUF2799 domain-containing protein [Pannonibacter phragmitetus]|uniref:DUF2799 domain-containing protein n=1 Tax=Pannonibacter phragmitetus TaxID=121719 RepID=UPI000F02B70A|nr:DUF2799 domain-containing protein [Pannonibacter phragmitetus]